MVQVPVATWQKLAVWHASCGQTTWLFPTHRPNWQVSVRVQALPSSQGVPVGATVLGEQVPLSGLQTPMIWHWSTDGHVMGLLPTQAPFWQVSVRVQALSSLQGVLLGAPVQ